MSVPSSGGGADYTVAFERLPEDAATVFGFTCTCPAFKFGKGKECKHILANKKNFCGWHQQHDGGQAVNGKCPRCGSETTTVMCAV